MTEKIISRPKVRLILEPISKRVMVPIESTVLNAILQLNYPVNAICGGKGTCGKCKIQVSAKNSILNDPTPAEIEYFSATELNEGFRLACQTKILGPSRVFLTDTFLGQTSQILTEGENSVYAIRPKFWKLLINVSKCSEFIHITSDYERLKEAIRREIPLIGVFNRKIESSFPCIKKIPEVIRANDGIVTVTLETNIVSGTDPILILNIASGNTTKNLYGVAFDIGTTTIVGYLIDLHHGEIVGIDSMLNPQTAIGEDIMTRIEFVSKSEENMIQGQKFVQDAINRIIANLCNKTDVDFKDIAEICVVGNTAMHHIFFGLPVKFLGRSPFPPVIQKSMSYRNYHLNLSEISLNSEIYSPPVIAGFVGADTVADIIAIRMDDIVSNTLLIDIGTNGEMVLGNKNYGLSTCSCAAGSAFEGAHIKYGMRGTVGAIELVKIDPDSWIPQLDVIGHVSPHGLCGSAIIDIVAELLRVGILTRSGNFNKKSEKFQQHERIRKGKDGYEYIIHSKELPATFSFEIDSMEEFLKDTEEILITQEDIREIQKAKGAFLSGARLLMKSKGQTLNDIDQLLIAGAFGTYIHKENALFIGLIPDFKFQNIQQIGNAAGEGAQALLLNTDLRELADNIVKDITYVEIANDPTFSKEFAESMVFPHHNIEVFPSLKQAYENIPLR